MGLVSQVFDEDDLSYLPGTLRHRPHALLDDRRQPRGQRAAVPRQRAEHGELALGHNGNIVNAAELRDDLIARRRHLHAPAATPK